MVNPAQRVISICGGKRAVADLLGVSISRVHRWTYPKQRGGTDGRIPTKHQHALLLKAREAGHVLAPSDFFPNEAVESFVLRDVLAP